MRDVQELAGHSSLQTTQGYIQGDTDAKRKLVDMIRRAVGRAGRRRFRQHRGRRGLRRIHTRSDRVTGPAPPAGLGRPPRRSLGVNQAPNVREPG